MIYLMDVLLDVSHHVLRNISFVFRYVNGVCAHAV